MNMFGEDYLFGDTNPFEAPIPQVSLDCMPPASLTLIMPETMQKTAYTKVRKNCGYILRVRHDEKTCIDNHEVRMRVTTLQDEEVVLEKKVQIHDHQLDLGHFFDGKLNKKVELYHMRVTVESKSI